ncbi:hypothetical protein H5410_026575 [Solanum commersonii]|uniref:Uncharacterized protein n=1 Tax=Solanum commersonii TaxID=4109 RepID=A0A9J5YWI4_SOLCO|nr:hypothetical protein H5410_026575 [Solanum commersonii]
MPYGCGWWRNMFKSWKSSFAIFRVKRNFISKEDDSPTSREPLRWRRFFEFERKVRNRGGEQWVFYAKSYYEMFLKRENVVLPYQSIQMPKIPRKVYSFTWLAAMKRKKVTYVDWCLMCKD